MTLWTWLSSPFLFVGILNNPLFYIFLVLLLAAALYVPVALKAGKFGQAFFSSSTIVGSMVGLIAISLFPRLVPSSTDLGYSLTIYNASSTPATLQTMLVIAFIGVPIVLVYTIFIHRVFRGKVEISEESY
jgi:cytochrome d ubiquinol oxidase subunit II